tara:strand:+ start:1434 stop:2153 length:720 start_codon:yes stop_codon:yes gene_type:complete
VIKAKKSLSQNFLIDKNISRKIIDQTDIKNRVILEIGPGYGFLTEIILEKKPKKLILIEKDSNLKKYLEDKYRNNKIVILKEMDILNFNLNNYKNLIIISNLPYNVSTKIILYLFKYKKNISEMILMIQKEVAEKFDYNRPKMNKYKFITNLVSTFNICFDVSLKVFKPKPKVKSSVVKFVFNKKEFDFNRAILFSSLIFKNVRKKIYNNIKTNKDIDIYNRRVNELSINELLKIYNLF